MKNKAAIENEIDNLKTFLQIMQDAVVGEDKKVLLDNSKSFFTQNKKLMGLLKFATNKNITKSPTPKLSVRFDKDTLTEAQFYALVNFMVQNEEPQNIFWLVKHGTGSINFKITKIEEAWFNDSVYGLQILS